MDRFREREMRTSEERREAEEQARRWKVENAEAIREYNEYVEKHGISLAEHRKW